MSALKKDTVGFVVQRRSANANVGVFSDFSTSSGSIRVMDKKTFDGAIDASNKLIREQADKIRSSEKRTSDERHS